jgi:hypothetical protein
MAFQQLYYTSCEHGLAGYVGYQFNAVTPEVPPTVMREVEERTVYEPPRWLLAEPALDEPEAYPVALSYGTSETTGAMITAHVVFSGADYSGRPGNYFAHALVTRTPEQDFGSLLPAELWESPVWRTSPVDSSTLPELTGPLPDGLVDRPGAQAFLDTQGADQVLPRLLTAVGQAMAGGPAVLLAGHDATENAWWIAAVSYLLGEPLARRMTFTTYSHRPGYARYHLIGVLPETVPADAATAYQLFDLTAGQTPGEAVHPLAVILARTGVLAAEGLWRQAQPFSSGQETALDDWLAPVAVAAGVLGQSLPPDVPDAVARWLPAAAGWMSPPLVDVALGVVLSQPTGTLTDERLTGLLGLAHQVPAPSRIEPLERILTERAVTQLSRGEAATPVTLTGPAVATARDRAAELLATAPPATAILLLAWTSASGAVLADRDLERYGQTRLDPASPAPEMAQLIGSSPAIMHGLLERLAAEPREVTETLLGGPVGALLSRDAMADYPALTELWLIRRVAQHGRRPLEAFDQIVDVRWDAGRVPLVDAALLRLLWPGGCPPSQLTELLGAFAGHDRNFGLTPDVVAWFSEQISPVIEREVPVDRWLRLVRELADHPILPLLPAEVAGAIAVAAHATSLLDTARTDRAAGQPDPFRQLYRIHAEADRNTRRLLERDLPARLAEARPLDQALTGCPAEVTGAFGRLLADRLNAAQPDLGLAQQLFEAICHPDVTGPALAQWLSGPFEQVATWRRRDAIALGQMLEDDGLADAFKTWRDTHRGPLTRKLLGGVVRTQGEQL